MQGRVNTTVQPSCPSASSIWTRQQPTPLRGRKRDIVSRLLIRCHYFWHLCFCFFALISAPFKRKKKPALFFHKRLKYYSLICDERTSGLAPTKIGTESKVYFEFPPTSSYIPFLLCSLQAVPCLSSNLLPHPLAPHPEFLTQCRKLSSQKFWCILGLFLIWSLIPSNKEWGSIPVFFKCKRRAH